MVQRYRAGDDAEVQREMVQRYRQRRYGGRWCHVCQQTFRMKDLKPRLAADDETERLKATSGSRLPRAADTSQSP